MAQAEPLKRIKEKYKKRSSSSDSEHLQGLAPTDTISDALVCLIVTTELSPQTQLLITQLMPEKHISPTAEITCRHITLYETIRSPD